MRERVETRIGCQAHMKIRLDKKNKKYCIQSLELNHNHILHVSQCAHMMPSQRRISHAQALEIDLAYDSGIKLKDSYEFMGRHASGKDVLGYTKQDHKNYLHSKRQRELKYGESGCLLRYFEKKKRENVSLYYALQLDAPEQITNIFWVDLQMIVDYKLFGDVVSFDTTYRTNKEYRPLAMFVGFNHHRKVVLFGAALLYNETIESFEWLFETFFEAMSGKKPNTIFTDQDPAMAKAISLVMPNTYHRLCTWHLMQNALKHIGHLLTGENEFRSDLNACFKVWEEEDEFLSAWDTILHKYNVCDNSWLQRLFEVKEKWAKAYVKMSFFAGMTPTQLSESLNANLKDYLQSDYDIVKFFTHFDRLLNDKRYKELLAEYNLRQKLPKIKMLSPMLVQAAKIYTSQPFLKFQKQYEEFQGAYVKELIERNSSQEYIVSFYDIPQDRRVIWNSLEHSVSCSCRNRAAECEEAYKIALENYTELSKKIEDVMRRKSDLCQVDNSQENPLNEDVISAKGLKTSKKSLTNPQFYNKTSQSKNPNHFRCAVPAIRPREEADSAFEFDVALDLHGYLHGFILERSNSVTPPDFAVVFEASVVEIEPSLHDRHEELLLLPRMNFPMAGMSTDNHCKRWNETSSFEEECLGEDSYCGR
ncbi:protein FAR1-RELATED SEQUENCE 5-like [Alnus glutinosa]|uniref:protein FAR1-RELATED SEQUENCE 5-like n=1 Tax=Alnus glutinosa TaxID=3517 RepID=UPI002D7A0FF9|nr:protein FAR1-RELATED SEQUENCE 5-like [Alnus glutinosa]